MDKERHIKRFEEELRTLANELQKHVSTETGEWSIKGFIDVYKNIYALSSDTKIISKILEIHIFPEILRFAKRNNYKIILAEHQNWYPDITFISKENEEVRFALDIKTTYRKSKRKVAGFTLGSHGTYFKERDKTKNIQFPYRTYTGHYVLGIIYTRTKFTESLSKVYKVIELQKNIGKERWKEMGNLVTVKELKSITSVIKDLEFFTAPKWKIASDSQGSGNTANIGSIKDIEDLKRGNGVFSELGEVWFDEYWMNYGVATMVKEGKTIKITNIWDFLEFKGRTDLFDKVVARGAKRRKKQRKNE